MRSGVSPALLVLLALLVGVAGGVLGAAGYVKLASPQQSGSSGTVPVPGRTGASVVSVKTDEDAIVTATKVAAPAAVKVTAFHPRTPRSPLDLFFMGPDPQPIPGIGSGFIFEFEGNSYVLTNSHVVSDTRGTFASKIELGLSDGTSREGRLIGADRQKDVAVIEIVDPPAQLPVMVLGDSDKLEIGEWIIAIGNPFNFEHTVTVGVVSAVGIRQIGNTTRNLIQTDAAINVGNSGGPLVNLAGQVVGINTLIYSPTGTSAGIGFAIPINEAKDMLYLLIHRGPWVGVGLRSNSEGFANAFGLATQEGVVVVNVERGSPADRAGLRELDVILSVDGTTVKAPDEVQHQVRQKPIGSTCVLEVQRDRERLSVEVKTGRMPEEAIG
ncbi:MAG: S1C family serine protease [Armatimonadota bacterium]